MCIVPAVLGVVDALDVSCDLPRRRPRWRVAHLMAEFGELIKAVQDATTKDPDTLAALSQGLTSVAEDSRARGSEHAEQSIRCISNAFVSAGKNGKEVLDHVLLEILPSMAALAPLSVGCAQALSAFCSLAVESCSPRDAITAFLEVIDQLLPSPNAAVLQYLCNLMGLLPQLLRRLSRRKAAFIVECLVPVASLARVHGEVLQEWLLAQLKLAACRTGAQTGGGAVVNDSSQDVLRRVDTYLAANWQQHEDFVKEVLHTAVPGEPDQATQQSCRHAVGNLILHLLFHLTASWPPPPLIPAALQMVQAPARPVQLPTADSVLAPAPMLAANSGKLTAPGATVPRPTAAEHCQPQQQALQSDVDAAAVVQSLLQLLQDSGARTWQELGQTDGGIESAGAALAALYAGYVQDDNASIQVMPNTRIETLKLACKWCSSLSEAYVANPLVVLKAIALLQLASAHMLALPDTAETASDSRLDQVSEQQQDSGATSSSTLAPAEAARQLLSHLKPCVGLLVSSMASGSPILRSQAGLALQQLLQAPGPAVSYCCLKELLNGDAGQQTHPEVAALLMQEVRVQLASLKAGADSPFTTLGSVELVLPWLQQQGTNGWHDSDLLVDKGNAVCAALAVVRLSLLQGRGQPANAAAASSSSHTKLKALLQDSLKTLSAAVRATLDALQAVNYVEQRPNQQQRFNAGSSSPSSGQHRMRIPGEAEGAGQAVDAWLAVSRVQEVLDRVLELL